MTKNMKVLDVFSGIGGFSLGLERAGMETIAFCEIDSFCRKVLRKHWPKIPIFEDIKTLHEKNISESVDVVCGGPPCQAASLAGKRRGTEDDRWLWPEAIRIVREFSPAWCIFENVPGILSLNGGLAIEQVFIDLENEGYEVWPFIIPACGVGADHRRNRIWIVAHSNSLHVDIGRLRTSKIRRVRPEASRLQRQFSWMWNVEPGMGRTKDGVSQRVDRLKALGNAIVPQIVENIGRAIIQS